MNLSFSRHRLRRKLTLISIVFLTIFKANAQSLIFNVKKFGAKGDGRTNDVQAIQRTIDAAKGKIGATVFFPRGSI